MTGWQGGGSSRQRCGPPRAARWNAAPSRAWRGAARHPRPRATPRVWRRGCGERGRVGRTRAARGGGGAARCDEEDGARRHHRSGVHRGRLRWGLWVLVRAHPPRRPTWKPGPTDATRDGPSSAAAAVWPAPHTRGERVWSWPLAAPAPGRDGGGSSHWSQLDCHGTSGSWPRCLRMGAAAACVGGGGGCRHRDCAVFGSPRDSMGVHRCRSKRGPPSLVAGKRCGELALANGRSSQEACGHTGNALGGATLRLMATGSPVQPCGGHEPPTLASERVCSLLPLRQCPTTGQREPARRSLQRRRRSFRGQAAAPPSSETAFVSDGTV